VVPGRYASVTPRSEARAPQSLQPIIRLEVGHELILTLLPEEACRSNRGYSQQTDTEDANKNLPVKW
jgi:hypothetical protein